MNRDFLLSSVNYFISIFTFLALFIFSGTIVGAEKTSGPDKKVMSGKKDDKNRGKAKSYNKRKRRE